MKIELNESLDFRSANNSVSLKEAANTDPCVDDESLIVEIEGIHDVLTRNNTLYTAKCLKESIPYWTAPYERPVIMHHNEKDGKIIGRVKAANLISSVKKPNSSALEFITNIGDEQGKKGILNGTLSTVSISGFSTDITCSICGTNIAEEGACEHEKGEMYDGKLCYWQINQIEPKELSFVIVPSDVYAQVTKVYPVINNNNKKEVKEMNNMFSNILELEDTNEGKASLAEGCSSEESDSSVAEASSCKEKKIVDEEVGKESDDDCKDKKDCEDDKEKVAELFSKVRKDDCQSDKDCDDDEDEDDDEHKDCDDEDDEDELKDKSMSELKASVKELMLKVKDLEKANAKLTKAVAAELSLKEAAEIRLVKIEQDRKIDVAEQINKTRKSIGLAEQALEELCTHSLDDLNSSLKTYKECKEASLSALSKMSVKSPVAVSESKDNTTVESSQTTTAKNLKEEVDFKKRLDSIFSF